MNDIKYAKGQVVWAKIKGFPWWPGIVARVYELNNGENKSKDVLVNFIGDNSHARLTSDKVMDFNTKYKQYSHTKNKKLQNSIKIANKIYKDERMKLENINFKDINQIRRKSTTSLERKYSPKEKKRPYCATRLPDSHDDKSSVTGSNLEEDQESNLMETPSPEVLTIDSLNSLTFSGDSQKKKKLTKLTSIQPLEIVGGDESTSSIIEIQDKPFMSWVKVLEEDLEKNMERIFKFFKNSKGPYSSQQEEIQQLNEFCFKVETNMISSEELRCSNLGRLFKYLHIALTECKCSDDSHQLLNDIQNRIGRILRKIKERLYADYFDFSGYAEKINVEEMRKYKKIFENPQEPSSNSQFKLKFEVPTKIDSSGNPENMTSTNSSDGAGSKTVEKLCPGINVSKPELRKQVIRGICKIFQEDCDFEKNLSQRLSVALEEQIREFDLSMESEYQKKFKHIFKTLKEKDVKDYLIGNKEKPDIAEITISLVLKKKNWCRRDLQIKHK